VGERVTEEGTPQLHRLTVARTARYATVGADVAHTARLWVAFHGYGQTVDTFLAAFADVVPPDTRVVAPEGLSRFYLEAPRADRGHLDRVGATWLTREDREDDLRDALGLVHAVVAREHGAVVAARGVRPALGVLGFSQGVAMSQRWLTVARDTPSLGATAHIAQHVLWAGGLAHDVPDAVMREAWRTTAVHVVWGTRDRFADEASVLAHRERVRTLATQWEAHTFDGGHRLEAGRLGERLRALSTPPAAAGASAQ